jgi:uncharacterized membrane protein SirB2
VVDTVKRWELENKKFNAELWTLRAKWARVTPDMFDTLYLFWSGGISLRLET